MKNLNTEFPQINKVFRKYCIFPSTQNRDEQIFSLVGLITRPHCRNISVDTIEKKFWLAPQAQYDQMASSFTITSPTRQRCVPILSLRGVNFALNAWTDRQTAWIPGHPPELSDYVKLLLTNGSSHVFEIDLVLKSILWRFLYQNFIHFGQVVCLLYGFEGKTDVLQLDEFFMKIENPGCLHFQYFLIKSFQRDKISLELKINLKKNT